MKTFGCAVILVSCFASPTHAANVYTGCAVPPSTFGNVWYFDPVHGKTEAAGGNGSQAAPWNNLQALTQAETGYSFPLLTTAPYRQVPVPGQPAVTKTANFNPATLTYDVLLKAGAPAICAGTAGPPTVDFLGVTRQSQASCAAGTPGYAAGAYSYPM